MTVTGMKEQVARFKIMETSFQAHEIREIIAFALQEVVDLARAKAPVLTGALKESITYTMTSDYAGEASVGVPYGAAQEYGFITQGGKRIAGKGYFAPAATKGQATLVAELKKYIAANTQGTHVDPPHARQGGGGGGGAHKYLRKEVTGAGTRYIYGPKRTTTTKRKVQYKPGPKKQPSTRFQLKKPGRSSTRRS
jgi:hypothetical protein